MSQDEPIFQNVTSAQRTTQISNNTYKPRTYKENWYAEEQFVSWTRQQRLLRDLECKDLLKKKGEELLTLSHAIQDIERLIETDKQNAEKLQSIQHLQDLKEKMRDALRSVSTKRLRVLMDMQINWRLVVCDIEKWTGEDASDRYPEYIQSCWEDYYGGCMARRQRKQLQEELSELEFPRLRAKHRKGLMYDWETDETAKQINSKRKKVTTMHPYVGLADKDTLIVGDCMRVSTNQYYKFKWFERTKDRDLVCGSEWTKDPLPSIHIWWYTGVNKTYKPEEDLDPKKAEEWARHVRQYHPKYKDAKTRAEINAKRIADIKRAHPDLDYF